MRENKIKVKVLIMDGVPDCDNESIPNNGEHIIPDVVPIVYNNDERQIGSAILTKEGNELFATLEIFEGNPIFLDHCPSISGSVHGVDFDGNIRILTKIHIKLISLGLHPNRDTRILNLKDQGIVL